MRNKIYKKSVLLFAIYIIGFFSLAHGATVVLQPASDGYSDLLKACYDCPVPPRYCCCSTTNYIRSGIAVKNGISGDCFDYGEYTYTYTGIIEFDISFVNGLFKTGQTSATLTLTIKSASYVLSNNYIFLSDIKDENENGIIEQNDITVQGTIGTAEFGNQVLPGYTITFDVTQALAHDLFDANQSAFSGFVLKTSVYDGSPAPIYVFHDHTSLESAPRLTITGPTLVTLSSLTASAKSGRVVLSWSTESETDNAGFNLFRSESENGNYTKINASLISGKGSSTQGAFYEFVDNNVQNRKTYYYKLEDIDLNGTSTMYGPVNATPRLIYGIGK